MTKSIDQLIGLLNKALGIPWKGTIVYPEGQDDWVKLLELATEQRMLPLVVSQFDCIPEEFRPKGKPIVPSVIFAEQLVEKSKVRVDLMRRLAMMFQERGLDVMFLKGWSLAVRYPDPELRVFSDIDYYLFGLQKEGEDVLAAEGITVSPYYHHHTQATWKGVLLESHYDFLDRENHACNRILDDALKSLADSEGHSTRMDLGDSAIENAYRMTPTMEAIFLMRHMSAHFMAAGMELRQLYDWVLLLQRDGDKVDWGQVKALYEQSGMMSFARIVSWLVREKLAVSLPAYLPEMGGKTAERVWDDLISQTGKNRFAKGSFRYYVREAWIFLHNRWKHRIVYPKESYWGLMLNYLRLKIKLGR